MTREEACLYAFNTLQADLVEYGQRLTTNINGTEVTLSAGGAQSRPWQSQQTRINSIRDDEIVQFAEEYFSKLVKTPDTDIFMRPAHTWVYDKKIQIGTWVDKDKLLETYTTAVSGRDLYDLLGSATIRDFDLEVYVDGHAAGESSTGYNNNYYEYNSTKEIFTAGDLKRSNTDDLGVTGRGVLTEVFIDKDNEVITVVSIHTWLARATTSYNENREDASVKVFAVNASGVTKTVNVDDVPEVADVTADTFYLVQMSDKDTNLLEVVNMEEPEILEDSTITKFSNGKDNKIDTKYPKELTTGGSDYKKSDRAFYDEDTLNQYDADLLVANTYNVYLDKYGNFIGIDLFEGTKQYVFVTGYDMKNSNLSIKTADAAGIFLDGTMELMTVNVQDTNKNIQSMVYGGASNNWTTPKAAGNEGKTAASYYKQWATHASDGVYLLNRWYTYTVTEAGVYTLKPCVSKEGEAMMLASKTANRGSADDMTTKMNCAKLRLDGVGNEEHLLMGESMTYQKKDLVSERAYGEDASVFITVDVDDVSASFNAVDGIGKVTRAITGVNGVWTGVQDVDLVTRTSDRVVGDYIVNGKLATMTDTLTSGGDWIAADGKSYVGENAYAVYDKNNFIIGAVILGEAEGNNATKAYILDPVTYERYDAATGTHYWQFKAVIGGEIVYQEAESKFTSTIDTMRKNKYEIVELRYNADGDTVVDVKEVERKDTEGTAANDKIYGYPFDEIKSKPTGHQVEDSESIYDVVLTGDDYAAIATPTSGLDRDGLDNGRVQFGWVNRPRTNAVEHNYGNTYTFKETELGTLRLQRRTLYVLNDQSDYGIDFVQDAKAVVIQPEGIVGDYSLETTAYSTVQEAIDSLGDAVVNPANTLKEFRGIITAVLNSQGVAEWIVFYSDTPVDTRNNTNVGQATMPVRVKYKLEGTDNSEASDYGIVYVAKDPVTGLAHVKDPDTLSNSNVIPGYHPTIREKRIIWDKNADPIKVVIFEYVANATPNPLDAAKAAIGALTSIPGVETPYTKEGARAAIKTAIEELVGSDITVAVADGSSGNGFKAAENGATKDSEGTPGKLRVKITLNGDTTNGVIDNKMIVLEALPYGAAAVADDEAALAAAIKALDEAAIGAITLSAKTDSLKYDAYTGGSNNAVSDIATAIQAILDAASPAFTGTKAIALEEDGFVAATNAALAANQVDGEVAVIVTLTLNGSTMQTGMKIILAAGTP